MSVAVRKRLRLFDLDGTLIDSEPGISASLAHAFDRIGAELPAREIVRTWIGPPFKQSFPSVLGGDAARIDAAIAHYRERFEAVGWSEHEVYEGIADLVAGLAATGDPIAIVTTKPLAQARMIVEHLPFGAAFERIYGPDANHAHCAKAEMIAEALRDFGVGAGDAVMVGDRDFDINGARANDVRAIGVSWGFGSIEELRRAGADAIVDAPADLAPLLLDRAPNA